MSGTTYKYSSEAFLQTKEDGSFKAYSGPKEKLLGSAGTSQTLQNTSLVEQREQQLFENMISEHGQFSILSNLNFIDDNGYFSDLGFEFAIYSSETMIGTVLEQLSAGQMTIVSEVISYTYTAFDEGNEQITLLFNGYNELTDPLITKSENNFLGIFDYSQYETTFSSQEIAGLQDRFGAITGINFAQQYESNLSTAASEVINAYQSRRRIFKRVSSPRIRPLQYGVVTTMATGSTNSATDTSTATTSSPRTEGGGSTSTSGGGY